MYSKNTIDKQLKNFFVCFCPVQDSNNEKFKHNSMLFCQSMCLSNRHCPLWVKVHLHSFLSFKSAKTYDCGQNVPRERRLPELLMRKTPSPQFANHCQCFGAALPVKKNSVIIMALVWLQLTLAAVALVVAKKITENLCMNLNFTWAVSVFDTVKTLFRLICVFFCFFWLTGFHVCVAVFAFDLHLQCCRKQVSYQS